MKPWEIPWPSDELESVSSCPVCTSGYQFKTGQPTKSGNCADRRKLFIAGLLPNSETSEPELLSRLKLVAVLRKKGIFYTLILWIMFFLLHRENVAVQEVQKCLS